MNTAPDSYRIKSAVAEVDSALRIASFAAGLAGSMCSYTEWLLIHDPHLFDSSVNFCFHQIPLMLAKS